MSLSFMSQPTRLGAPGNRDRDDRLGASVSPPIVGWFKDATGSFSGGLYALAIFGLMAAIVAALCVRETPVAVAQQPIGAAAD